MVLVVALSQLEYAMVVVTIGSGCSVTLTVVGSVVATT